MAEKKADKRRKEIIDVLSSNGTISYEYILNHFKISERSMQQDIKELIKQGYDIKGVKSLKGYILRNENKTGYYEPANTQNMRALYILGIIEKHHYGISTDEIYKCMESEQDNVEMVANKKTLVATLGDMTLKKQISYRNGKYNTSVNAPVRVAMSTSEAMDTLNLLETFSKGNPFEDTLIEVKKKLLIALFNDTCDEEDKSYEYVVYKKGYSTAGKLPEYIEKLNSFPFENKGLIIEFLTKDNISNRTIFYVGNVVYSVDKDRLYLIGENDLGKSMIIHYDSIESIEEDDSKNNVFQNDFYSSIVDDMFSISLDLPKEVEVIFDNVFQIKEKIMRVVMNRKNASLEEADNKLIYRDKISGLWDFAAYLRRFGSACEVIKPYELRTMMKNTAIRTLEAYDSLCEGQGNECK